MAEAPEDSNYLYVGVGDRTFWKDQNNVFRTAKETQLKRFEGFTKFFINIFPFPACQLLSNGELSSDWRKASW